MAIFQTGSETSVPNLLNTLAAFCVANGWTQNFNAVEGSGRRVHLQLSSDVFINMRALVNESPNTVRSLPAVSGLNICGSTSYVGGTHWWNQTGFPTTSTANDAQMAGITHSGAVPTYYFFARGNMIYVWLEYTAGSYQWLMFGRVSKTSTWTGGSIFAGSGNGRHSSASLALGRSLVGNISGSGGEYSQNSNGYMYGVIDGNTGWMPCDNSTLSPAMPKFYDSFVFEYNMFNNQANTFNSQPVLQAVEICITRDGTGNVTFGTTNFSIAGLLPDIYYCNMRHLLAGQQLDDGSGDTFRVLPLRAKTSSGSSAGWMGVAIKEN